MSPLDRSQIKRGMYLVGGGCPPELNQPSDERLARRMKMSEVV